MFLYIHDIHEPHNIYGITSVIDWHGIIEPNNIRTIYLSVKYILFPVQVYRPQTPFKCMYSTGCVILVTITLAN